MSASHKTQSGLSIVEALVTMVILLIVLGGVYQIFQSNSLTYRMQEGLSRLQENGRFAMEFIIKDLRMAGYLGCLSSLDPNIMLNSTSEYSYKFDQGVEIFSANGTISYPINGATSGTWSTSTQSNISKSAVIDALGVTNVLAGSDILTVRYAMQPEEAIIESTPSFVRVGQNSNFNQCDIVIANDCVSADIFQIIDKSTVGNATQFDVNGTTCNTDTGPGNKANPKLTIFLPEAHLMGISSVSFYVAINSANQPSLYRKIGTGASQELVEGVEAIKISPLSSMETVQIGLLLRTPEEIRGMDLNAGDTPTMLGTTIGPANDRRMRRVFEATVGIRNSLQ